MKAPEVYKTLRDDIGPWAAAGGFKRTKTMLSWYRPCGRQYIVFWFQVSRHGWDTYAGSEFTVEFQLSPEPVVGEVHSLRRRLSEFLDDASREEARQIQNQILASIPRPPPDYWLLEDPRLRAGYLREFDPHPRYSRRHDIWFRYHAPEHLHRWSEFMLRHFPRCIQELEAAEAQQQAAPQQRRAWWKLW